MNDTTSNTSPLPTVRVAVREAIAETRATGVQTVPVTAASDPHATTQALQMALAVERWLVSNRYTAATVLSIMLGFMIQDNALSSPGASWAWLLSHWWPLLIGQIIAPALRAFKAAQASDVTPAQIVMASRS